MTHLYVRVFSTWFTIQKKEQKYSLINQGSISLFMMPLSKASIEISTNYLGTFPKQFAQSQAYHSEVRCWSVFNQISFWIATYFKTLYYGKYLVCLFYNITDKSLHCINVAFPHWTAKRLYIKCYQILEIRWFSKWID